MALEQSKTDGKSVGGDVKVDSEVKRTISMESIAPKLTSLFRKRKRARDDEEDTPAEDSAAEESGDGSSSSDGEKARSNKRRKVKTEQQVEIDAREKELDEALPEEIRKYRPQGFSINIPPKDRAIRVYADGVFDLFHLGHMKQLEQAKKSFPNVELVCGIPSDLETHKRKGLTVLTDKQRIETLKHCRWVDEVIPNAPWCVTPSFLIKHKIDYVAHDDLPYASSDSDDIYKPIKEMGMFLTTQRTEGISTSDIITKIIRDYDKYLMRNFARGATRKELNVSWLKKNELEFKKHVNDFRTYWTKNRVNINNVSKDLYFEVREYIKGKRSEVSSLLDNISTHIDSDDGNMRATSPLAEFASKYIGNANKDLNGHNKSLLANVREWIKGDDSHDDYSTNDETDSGSFFIKRTPSKLNNATNEQPNMSLKMSDKSPDKSVQPMSSSPATAKPTRKTFNKKSKKAV